MLLVKLINRYVKEWKKNTGNGFMPAAQGGGMGTKMKNRMLILQGDSRYGALHFMIDELEKYICNNTNLEVFKYCIKQSDNINDIILFINQINADYIFCVQAVMFDIEKICGRNVLSEFRADIIGWIVDPPIYHCERIKCMSDDMKLLCVDGVDADYAQRFYDVHSDTLHLFGIEKGIRKDIKDRKIHVFAPGSIRSTINIQHEVIEKLNETLQNVVYGCLNLMLQDERISVVSSLEKFLSSAEVEYTSDEVMSYMEFIGPVIDTYYRNSQREYCIQVMLNAGIEVTVCGNGWEEFARQRNTHGLLKNLGEDIPYDKMLEYICDSKVVLNVSPSFLEGVHDRVSCAMLNGSVALSNVSSYLKNNFSDGEDILFYNCNDFENDMGKVKSIINNDGELQKIANNAYKIAKEKFSVKQFCDELLNSFNI